MARHKTDNRKTQGRSSRRTARHDKEQRKPSINLNNISEITELQNQVQLYPSKTSTQTFQELLGHCRKFQDISGNSKTFQDTPGHFRKFWDISRKFLDITGHSRTL